MMPYKSFWKLRISNLKVLLCRNMVTDESEKQLVEKLKKYKIYYNSKDHLLSRSSKKLSRYPSSLFALGHLDSKDQIYTAKSTVIPVKTTSDSSEDVNSGLQFLQNEIGEEPIGEFQETLAIMLKGTENSSAPSTTKPCVGCGALLQCSDSKKEGFIPYEKYNSIGKKEMESQLCRRCFFMNEYNIALNLNIHPDEYVQSLKCICEKYALVILVLDISDLPGSLWPNIGDIIGSNPVVVVCNKVDVVPRDSVEYLQRIKDIIIDYLKPHGLDKLNIQKVELISAKTGFGIESLITYVHSNWHCRGDIYILGCTNAGKSTLFNKFIFSDLCKSQAVELMHKATISNWPGTTLGLVKFPIARPKRDVQYLRTKRLELSKMLDKFNRNEGVMRARLTNDISSLTLGEDVGRSKMPNKQPNNEYTDFSINYKEVPSDPDLSGLLDVNDPRFSKGRWCYDTPGTVNKDQLINFLTPGELEKALPDKIILSRTIKLFRNQTLFIGGIGRVDFLRSSLGHAILLTLFISDGLPLFVLPLYEADAFYRDLLGSDLLEVPIGGPRLNDWPNLAQSKFELSGIGWKKSCVDITLNSLGWTAVTTSEGNNCEICVHLPTVKGVTLRPPFLPFAVQRRGQRKGSSPAFLKPRLFFEIEMKFLRY